MANIQLVEQTLVPPLHTFAYAPQYYRGVAVISPPASPGILIWIYQGGKEPAVHLRRLRSQPVTPKHRKRKKQNDVEVRSEPGGQTGLDLKSFLWYVPEGGGLLPGGLLTQPRG